MKFIVRHDQEGVYVAADAGSNAVSSLDDWDRECPATLRGALALLYALVENECATKSDNCIVLPHATVASLSATDAQRLGLPPNIPLRVDIRSDGDISCADFKFRIRWITHSGLPLQKETVRCGSIVSVANKTFRLPEPVFSVLERIADFNASPPADTEEKLLAWGNIRALLGENPAEIANDYYLRDTRVFSGRRFTLHLEPKGTGDVVLEPVLVAERKDLEDSAGETTGLEEDHPVLPGRYQRVFASRFSSFKQARTGYPLEDGVYVVVDPACKQALDVVRRAIAGTAEERLAFCRNPRAVLVAELGDSFPQDVIEDIFVETEQFSARVKEIGLWQKKVLPWISRAGESWLPPEHLGLMIDGKRIEIDAGLLPSIKDLVERQLQSGGGSVQIGSETVQVSNEVLAVIETLLHESAHPHGNAAEVVPDETENGQPTRKVLVIHDNFDGVDYQVVKRTHRPTMLDTPAALRTSLKKHQRTGLRWIQNHWIEGSPGALLADDMGLGKTLLILSFLAWVKEEIDSGMCPKKPMLVVAPVGLLKNWEAEHDLHMMSPGIGEMIPVYGQRLRQLKRSSGNELAAGESLLDREQLQQADWILTNYETLRDYQISFGLIPFSIAVFDEAQKIKTPGTLMTEAAKAINADFTVTMTGTPVENRLADLWCIVDTAQPGVLGDLKSFSAKFENDPQDGVIQTLKDRIWHTSESNQRPGLMLRRMKEETLDALPAKHVHAIERTMPTFQANAYAKIVNEALGNDDAIILETIHHLRSVSLHPFLAEGSGELSDEEYIASSARLSVAIAVLDEVKQKGEKALVFLESLDMQRSSELPLILKRRYGLPSLPLVINGSVAAVERQVRVNRFQTHDGFDVMILSPRAGGVGLTLTAANHVIHLSRWWNPAVEDQSTDRVYRIGQTRPVHVYYPIAVHPALGEHSFDIKLHALIERKRLLSRSLLIPPSANTAEITALFRETISV